MAATCVTLTFKKNGVRGEIIGLCRSGDTVLCPVRAAARRIIYLWRHNAPPGTPLARLYQQKNLVHHTAQPKHITPTDITKVIRQAVTFLEVDLGFLPSDVSARSLRASGANALLLAHVDTNVIRLIGRWQ